MTPFEEELVNNVNAYQKIRRDAYDNGLTNADKQKVGDAKENLLQTVLFLAWKIKEAEKRQQINLNLEQEFQEMADTIKNLETSKKKPGFFARLFRTSV